MCIPPLGAQIPTHPLFFFCSVICFTRNLAPPLPPHTLSPAAIPLPLTLAASCCPGAPPDVSLLPSPPHPHSSQGFHLRILSDRFPAGKSSCQLRFHQFPKPFFERSGWRIGRGRDWMLLSSGLPPVRDAARNLHGAFVHPVLRNGLRKRVKTQQQQQ